MKTAEDEAKAIIAELSTNDLLEGPLDVYDEWVECVIVEALKARDRDTRHACAESLSECPIAHPHTSTKVIRLAAAYEKVMNTKAL